MSSELKTNKISPATGTALTLADSGDTLTLPSGATLDIASGATITNSGSQSGFGKVLQVVQATHTTAFSTTSTTAVDTGQDILITPSSTSNKVWLTMNVSYFSAVSNGIGVYIYRNDSLIFDPNWNDGSGTAYVYVNGGNRYDGITISYLDSPSSTSEQTYSLYINAYSSGSAVKTPVDQTTDGKTIMTALEVAG